LLVGLVWALDTTHQMAFVATEYAYVVTWYGHTDKIQLLFPVALSLLPLTGVIDLLVQIYFIYRFWRLSGKNWMLSAV